MVRVAPCVIPVLLALVLSSADADANHANVAVFANLRARVFLTPQRCRSEGGRWCLGATDQCDADEHGYRWILSGKTRSKNAWHGARIGVIRWKRDPTLCWTAKTTSSTIALQPCSSLASQIFEISGFRNTPEAALGYTMIRQHHFDTYRVLSITGITNETSVVEEYHRYGNKVAITASLMNVSDTFEKVAGDDAFFQNVERLPFFLWGLKASRAKFFFLYSLIVILFVMYLMAKVSSLRRAMKQTPHELVNAAWKHIFSMYSFFCNTAKPVQVRQLASEFRIQRARSAFGWGVNLIVAPLLLYNIWHYTVRSSGALTSSCNVVMVYWVHKTEFATFTLIATPAVFLHIFPRFITGRTLDAIRMLLSFVWVYRDQVSYRFSMVLQKPYVESFEHHSVIRMILSIILGNARWATVVESVATIAHIVLRRCIPENAGRSDFLEDIDARTVGELAVLLWIMWFFDWMTEREAWLVYEANQSKIAENLASSLLTGLCDFVVHTDGQGCIQRSDPRLAVNLLHEVDAGPSLINSSIQSYMKGDDIQRFDDYMTELQSQLDTNAPVRPLHVDLYDCINNKLSVELFCSCVKSVYDETHTIIGITEVGHREAEAMMALPRISTASHDLPLVPASKSLSAAQSSCSDETEEDLCSDENYVVFSAQTFHIKKCGAGFRERTGLRIGSSLFTDAVLNCGEFIEQFNDLSQPIRLGTAVQEVSAIVCVKMSLFRGTGPCTELADHRKRKRRTYDVAWEMVVDVGQLVFAEMMQAQRVRRLDTLSLGTPSLTASEASENRSAKRAADLELRISL